MGGEGRRERRHGQSSLLGTLLVVASLSPAIIAPEVRAQEPKVKVDLCAENYDSVAVVIGNKDYAETGEVPYALNDMTAMKAFLVDKLCYREANVIELKDATFGKLLSVLGSATNPQGQLWDWARPSSANVFVYYSGHGAPDIRTGTGFLVPVDSDPNWPSLGLSLDTLVRNLKALKAERLGPDARVTLMLDACFSGKAANGGSLIKGSFTGWTPKYPATGTDIIRISAAGADQIARWDEEKQRGLLTSVFLDGVDGAADRGRMGNNDGAVSGDEVAAYVAEEVPYLARRRYRDDQTPELPETGLLPWRFTAGVNVAPADEAEIARLIQTELNRVGCEAGEVDGVWGKASEAALGRFARYADLELASLSPTDDLLETIRKRAGRVCPLSCSVTEEIEEGRCVTKTCPAGQRLSSRGQCYVEKARAPSTAARAQQRSKAPVSAVLPPRSKTCYEFNGKNICQ